MIVESLIGFLIAAPIGFMLGWWLAGFSRRNVTGYQPRETVNQNNPPRDGSGICRPRAPTDNVDRLINDLQTTVDRWRPEIPTRPEPPLNVICREDQDPRKARRGTLAILLALLFVAPAQAADKAIVPSWGVNPVRYCVAKYPQIQAKRIVDRGIYAAFQSWSRVCDLRFEEVKNPQHANIVIWFDPRVFGGQSQVPPTPLFTGQINLWINGASDYNRLGVAFLQARAGHEIGHAIGLWRHSERTDQLMSKNVVRVVVPQWEDVQRSVKIYGEKR